MDRELLQLAPLGVCLELPPRRGRPYRWIPRVSSSGGDGGHCSDNKESEGGAEALAP
jgi:hypothetical protein